MRIYHNNRDGTFTQVNHELGMNGCWGTMSANIADVNNDGHLDVVLGNGSPKMDRLDPMVLMEFDGYRFRNTTFAAGLAYRGKSHGVNMADLFGDGRMSILVASGGQYPGDLLTTSVYYAKHLAGNYVNIRLVGVMSNRSAIGAKDLGASERQMAVPRNLRRHQLRLSAARTTFRFGRQPGDRRHRDSLAQRPESAFRGSAHQLHLRIHGGPEILA